MSNLSKFLKNFTPDFKISFEDLLDKIEKNEVILIDVRYPEEKAFIKIPFAKDIPINELPDKINDLPKDKILVFVCSTGQRALICMLYAIERGYKAKILVPPLQDLIKLITPQTTKLWIKKIQK